jgi:ATP-dependent RNA helicase DDX5/DBP2
MSTTKPEKITKKLKHVVAEPAPEEHEGSSAIVQEKRKKKKKERKESPMQAEETNGSTDHSADIMAVQKKKKKKKNSRKQGSDLTVTEAAEEQLTQGASSNGESAPSKKKKKIAKAGVASVVDGVVQPVLSKEEVNNYYTTNNISVDGTDCPFPITSFAAAPFPASVVRELEQQGFQNPTPIQAASWPVALAKRDLVGLAETGSGKTLAFLLPGLVHVESHRKSVGKLSRKTPVRVLVLAPTRELAMQIHQVCNTCKAIRATSVCVYGGVPKGQHQAAVRNGCDVLVATPGRLIDLLETQDVDLSTVSYLVLDEADRMLDMGFEPQLKVIMEAIPSQRQTLMFSATWPSDVQRLAKSYLSNPIKVTIGSVELSGNQKIVQTVEVVEEFEKQSKLQKLLTQWCKGKDRILVFMLYKKTCDKMANTLARQGWPAVGIHGDMSQAQRNNSIAAFKSGESTILVATDVAARGLDIKNIKYVINVEFPLRIEDYVHRIGRTGRAGETGKAHTLFTKGDKDHARDLVKVLSQTNQIIDPALQHLADTCTTVKPKQNAWTKLYGVSSNALAYDDLRDIKPKRTVFD